MRPSESQWKNWMRSSVSSIRPFEVRKSLSYVSAQKSSAFHLRVRRLSSTCAANSRGDASASSRTVRRVMGSSGRNALCTSSRDSPYGELVERTAGKVVDRAHRGRRATVKNRETSDPLMDAIEGWTKVSDYLYAH